MEVVGIHTSPECGCDKYEHGYRIEWDCLNATERSEPLSFQFPVMN
jgi:hypothetical protein